MFINLHTHTSASDPEIVEIVNQYPSQIDSGLKHFSVGIHPWHIHEDQIDEELGIIEIVASTPNCIAIGECGLDKRIDTPMHLQINVFEKQLILAEKLQMPVIIHCVVAFNEVIAIKNRLKIKVPLVIHGFSKNEETAKTLVENGFYLSFGKYLLRNPELKNVFNFVPNDRFFLETDTAQEDIRAVYNLAAKYKAITLGRLMEIVQNNFNTVFKNGRMD